MKSIRGEGPGETIESLRRQLGSGQRSPSEIAGECLRRAHSWEPHLNAFQEIVETPSVPSGSVPSGGDGLLWGIPYLLKANIAQASHRLDCESRILQGHLALHDATVQARLAEAGAICLGRTRMDEFAMGSSGERAISGSTSNPWDLDRVPGGSSSGSAAAVAAGIVPFALGSDTGGSIRQPAAFCGCVGLKPTWGRVSRYGLVAFASSLDQIGPLTLTVPDAALVLSVIMGPDPRDSTTLRWSLESPLEDPEISLESLEGGLSGTTVGVPWALLEGRLSGRVEAEFNRVLELMKAAGARLIELKMPLSRSALAVYAVLANAEASSNLARYDGLRTGRSGNGKDHGQAIRRARGEGFGEEVKLRILLGTFVLSEGYHEEYYARAHRVRVAMAHETDEALARCDVLAWPTTSETAFPRGQRLDDPVRMYESDFLTVQANLTGHPAVALPTGLSDEGLPFSLQLTGRRWGEWDLLKVARPVEKLCDFQRHRSSLQPPSSLKLPEEEA